jgi:hypothetical protein
MTWDPTIPATNADLLSAPVRDNFAALETSIMGALGALATQQVLLRAPGPAIGGVAAGTDGQVLTLATGVPVWQAAPTGGGAVGEWNWSTITTSPATGTQMRLNAAHPYTAATTLWVRYQTVNGTDARIALLLTKPGQTLHIQDKTTSTNYVRLSVTATPTDDTANGQVILPVAWIGNGNAIVNNQNVLMIIGAAQSAATIIDAKGDLIVGTAPDTATRLGVGTDGQVLMAEAAQATGLKWAAPMTNPMTNIGDLIRGDTAGIPTRLAAVATGAVLASAGVNTAPTWNTSPSLTGLTLSGMTQGSVLFIGASGAITQDNASLFFDDANNSLRLGASSVGTSGQRVLALGPGTAPTTSPVDTVQLFTADRLGEAGSRGLVIRTERGGTIELTSDSGPTTQIHVTDPGGTARMYMSSHPVYAGIGMATAHSISFWTSDVTRGGWDAGGEFSLGILGLAPRVVSHGAIDSGGAGYRLLRITN